MKTKLPFFLSTGVIAFVYFSIAVLLLNTALVTQTIFSSMSPFGKISLLWALIESAWGALATTDFFLLILTSLLVGINITLSISLLARLQKIGTMGINVGGGTMVGIFSAGCSSCGFSALSLFGLSGTIALFPLRGAELYIIAISLLTLSLYYNVKQFKKPLLCKTPTPVSERVKKKQQRRQT